MKTLLALLVLASIMSCVPVGYTTSSSTDSERQGKVYPYYQDRSFQTDDRTYDPYIRSVQLYPNFGSDNAQSLYPIVPLSQMRLILEFDELGADVSSFSAKIFNCRADWTISELNPTEYLNQYNDFAFFDQEFSANTKVAYVHYRFEIPPVKVAGNYVIKVFRNNDEDDLVLSRRFMVYSEKTVIAGRMDNVSGAELAQKMQQITFQIKYGNLNVINPQQQIKAVIRQNNRWDNAITDLQPSFIKTFQKTLDYQHFNLENAFLGGNEFRMCDIRGVRPYGWGVDSVYFGVTNEIVYMRQERIRKEWVYNRQFEDINGRYVIMTREPSEADRDADYYEVHFYLKSPQKYVDKVYLFGAMSDWRIDERFELEYLADKQLYHLQLDLKQGLYNYLYVTADALKKLNDEVLEGSHNRTQNEYDILVYYSAFGARTDELVGYKKL